MMTRHGYPTFWRIGLMALLALFMTACGGGGGSDNEQPAPPAAELTASFTQQVSGLDVSLDASASTGDIASYQWDFGDGTTGTGKSASHSYAAAGTYSVTLTVADVNGKIESSVNVINIKNSSNKQGRFLLSSAVSGVEYRTSSGIAGITDESGFFSYRIGDKINFFIGSLDFGEVVAGDIVTVSDFKLSHQVAQFLLTMDSDVIAGNGIQISEKLRDYISGSPISTLKPTKNKSSLRLYSLDDFYFSTENQLLVDDLAKNSDISSRHIATDDSVEANKLKGTVLKLIKNNNPELYLYLTGSFQWDGQNLPENTNIHKMLASRLASYFYLNGVRSQIESLSNMHFNLANNVKFNQAAVDDFVNKYLNVGGLAVEFAVYSADIYSGKSDEEIDDEITRRLAASLLTSGKSDGIPYLVDKIPNKFIGSMAKDLIPIYENCIGDIYWPLQSAQDAISKVVGKRVNIIYNCVVGEATRTVGRIYNTYQGAVTLQEYQYYSIAQVYLDAYFSCGFFNSKCMSELLGGKESVDDQIQYIMDEKGLNYGVDYSVRVGAKYVIDGYITSISESVNSLSAMVPSDLFFNYQYGNRDVSALDAAIEAVRIDSSASAYDKLWLKIDIANQSGRDIFVTTFLPKLILNNREVNIYSDCSGDISDKILGATYSANKWVEDMIIPLCVDKGLIPDTGVTRFLVRMDFKSKTGGISNNIQRILDLDVANLRSSYKSEYPSGGHLKLKVDKGFSIPKYKYYLPSILIGNNQELSLDNVCWRVKYANNFKSAIKISRDSMGYFFVVPDIKDSVLEQSIILNGYSADAPYANPVVFEVFVKNESVLNTGPVVVLGPDFYINHGSVTSISPVTAKDTDGQIVAYHWFIDGRLISEENILSIGNDLSIGTHLVTLKVTDNAGAVAGDNLQLVVQAENKPPVANAGADITINDGEVANLNGSASSDPDGSIASYEWWLAGQLQGSSSRLTLSKLAVGSHVATLKVRDNQGLVASDTVTIVVKALPPRLDVSASTLDFGSAAYDIKGAQFASKSLTISNGGGQPLTNIKPVLASNTGGFTLNDVVGSFTLAPGAKRYLTLSAAPKTIGEFSANLQITADGGFSKSVTLKSLVNANDLVHRVIPSATSLVVGDTLVLRVEMTSGNPEYQVSVEWGDGKVDRYTSQSTSLAVSHVYSAAATPTVKVVIDDVGGKHGETSVPLTISGSMPSSTRWSAQAHHIESDEFAANVPISVSAETLDAHPVQRYSTSWAPQKGSNDEYFIKYRLPIPSGLIKLSHKARLTVVVSPSTIAAYDRELAFVTDQGELIAGWLAETEPVVPGYLQFKPFASDLIRNEPTGALNDDPLLHPQQSLALEWQANQLQAQHYAGGSYTPLATMSSLSGSTLNEINLSFKGNGAIWLVKFEYDADNNGQYDDGAIFANTANQQVDWSIYTGVTPPPVTAGRLNDTGITSCADASSWSLPCPVEGFPGQDAESGRDVSANDDSDGHAGFSFTKLDASGEALSASAPEWSCVQDNVTGLLWEIHTDDGGLRDKDNTYSWYNPDATTNGGHAGLLYGGTCSGGISCDTQGYVAAVNAAGLCGYHDWRLPTLIELQGLVDYSIPAPGPTIDTNFFPDTQQNGYWSSSAVVGFRFYAELVYFSYGNTYWDDKGRDNHLRLVRSEP